MKQKFCPALTTLVEGTVLVQDCPVSRVSSVTVQFIEISISDSSATWNVEFTKLFIGSSSYVSLSEPGTYSGSQTSSDASSSLKSLSF